MQNHGKSVRSATRVIATKERRNPRSTNVVGVTVLHLIHLILQVIVTIPMACDVGVKESTAALMSVIVDVDPKRGGKRSHTEDDFEDAVKGST